MATTKTKLYGTDPKLPNYARPEYVALEDDLNLIADELAGTRAMHARSTTYIRKWSAEKDGNYSIRRTCETFFEGFGRTLSAAVGMLFAKPPQIEWNAAEELMAPHWANIDGVGNAGEVFVKRFSESSLAYGLGLILVDHPTLPDLTEEEASSQTDRALGLRPLWRAYHRPLIINWMVDVIDNRAVLTQLTLVESVSLRLGKFGVKAVLRYRDLRLEDGVAKYTLREWRDEGVGPGSSESFTDLESGEYRNKDGVAATFLPVAIAYTGRSYGVMEASIPLLGVAWANLAHWQLSTSLRFNTEVAGLAQPTVEGELMPDPVTGEDGTLDIGPLVTVQVEKGGKFYWSEPAGTGLERLALLVLEKVRQIAALGVSFMQRDTRAPETAEAKRLDAAAENATLATAATGIEDAVNLASEIHAWYLGIPREGAPTVRLSREFEDTTMQADVMRAYVDGLRAGLPVRILLEAWKAGGRIPADADLDELEMEMLAGAQAQAEAQAMEAEQQRQEMLAGAAP